LRISVVIPTYNRREALGDCISTLLKQDLPADHYEIVVVVDGSTDGTATMLRSLTLGASLIVIEQPNRGKSAALNVGMKSATGEIVLIIDDDVLCDRTLLSTHLAAHQENSRKLVFGRILSVLPSAPSFAERTMHRGLEEFYARLDSEPGLKWPEHAWAGPNCSMARSVFFEAGGSDEENFPRRAEDSDLGLRLWKMGIRFQYEPRASVTHRWVKTNRQYWEDCVEDGASLVRLSRKHPETRAYWGFAGMAAAPFWKLTTAKLSCSNMTIAKTMLGILVGLSEHLVAVSWARKGGERLYTACAGLAAVSGAHREAGSWRILRALYGLRLPVLLYHHVGTPNAETTKHGLSLSPKQFKRQMRWLQWRGYVGITSSQWLAWREQGIPLPTKPVLITFDDAYADIAQNAFPHLERFGHRASVFVITGLMKTAKTWEKLPVMTEDQVRHWAARGIEFAAHTRTHPELTELSASRVEEEVVGSKEDLEEIGLKPLSFAYPFGRFNDQVRCAAQRVFSVAFTCEEGVNDLRTDLLLLKRAIVSPRDTILDVEFKLALGRNPLDFLRSRLRIRSRIAKALENLSSRS
jgi:GT2 family glycosyltransferase/peptidoglycan/xylan/chitin deacetylase (PgdA/CDA1 family)